MTSPAVQPGGASAQQIEAVAAILVAYGTEQATLRALSQLWGYSRDPRATLAALRLSDHAGTAHRGTKHTPRLRGRGAAARELVPLELRYRAAYIYNAAARISNQLLMGKSLMEAVQRERPYYQMHEAARKSRQIAAKRVDTAAGRWGALLGWHAHHDDRTTPDCVAADGKNFRVGEMPRIGYPGMPHGFCRCVPGPPFATSATVDDATFGIRGGRIA